MRTARRLLPSLRTGFVLALGVVLSLAVSVVVPRPVDAQLISPGKLAQAHASLEGMSNCTQCHDLGKPGISNTKCLACHVPLRDRVQAREGLHATYGNRSCAACHKDHFGTDFQLVRFDTAGFDHKKVGYELKLSHRAEGCRSCHKPDLVVDPAVRAYATRHRVLGRTYLGLGTGCTDCHKQDNVHGTQFGTRTCSACHDEGTWEKAPLFSHDSSRYVLTGRHREVQCEDCHKPQRVAGVAEPVTRYAGVRFQSCTNCHADYHKGAMPQRCEQCHSTDGWRALKNKSAFETGFDHDARTDFKLVGAHAPLACASCHDPRRRATATIRMTWAPAQLRAMYPAPDATSCLSCHVDAHDSTFVKSPGGANCASCHNETTWLPSFYDLARHNRETYVLTGAHVAVPCVQCHQPVRPGAPPRFRVPAQACADCHRTSDPHAGQFGARACTECHTTEQFKIPVFDHAKTRWPLDAAHRDVACAKCHTVTQGPNGIPYTRYRPLETTCRACHGATTPRRP
jgi:hypothetical protein